jgi:hypothetical protein
LTLGGLAKRARGAASAQGKTVPQKSDVRRAAAMWPSRNRARLGKPGLLEALVIGFATPLTPREVVVLQLAKAPGKYSRTMLMASALIFRGVNLTETQQRK